MSHRFRRPRPYTKKGREEAEVRKLALHIRSQEQLNRILESCDPLLRFAAFERLKPHLGFENPAAPQFTES